MDNVNQPLPKLKAFPLALILISVTVCLSFAGAFQSEAFALCTLTVCAVMLLLFAKSIPCILLIALPCAISFLYISDIRVAAFYCSAIMAIGLGAFAVSFIKHPAVLLCIIPVAYGLSLLVSRNPVQSLLCLIYVPAIAALAHFLKVRRTRIQTICLVSITFALTLLAALLAYIAFTQRSLSPDAIKASADLVYEKVLSHSVTQYAELAAIYEAKGISAAEAGLTVGDARLYAISVFGILPALSIALINIIVFSANRLTLTLFTTSGQIYRIGFKSLLFSMSPISALIYIVAYVVMAISSASGNDMIALTAQNIYIILLPGLVLIGFFSLLGRNRTGKAHMFWIAALALLAISSISLALAVTAFIGSSAIIRASLRKAFPSEE